MSKFKYYLSICIFMSVFTILKTPAKGKATLSMQISAVNASAEFKERSTDPFISSESYLITKAKSKNYGAQTFLVQSTPEPISLGKPMVPYVNLDPLRKFMKENGIKKKSDSPEEVFLYKWTNGAQGNMIFQIGFTIDDTVSLPEGTSQFQIMTLPPMKFSSVFYEGPFPGKNGSGWEKIKWEERAKEAGFHYNEILYRELYHKFGRADGERNLTEIEISID